MIFIPQENTYIRKFNAFTYHKDGVQSQCNVILFLFSVMKQPTCNTCRNPSYPSSNKKYQFDKLSKNNNDYQLSPSVDIEVCNKESDSEHIYDVTNMHPLIGNKCFRIISVALFPML